MKKENIIKGVVNLDKTKQLASKLRDIRQFGKFGTLEVFSKKLDVNKNTIGAYERGERLPDVDYLCVFSKNTKSNFFELLISRLKSSSHQEAKDISKDIFKEFSEYQSKKNINDSNQSTTTTSDRIITVEPTSNEQTKTINETVKLLIENYDGSNKSDRNLVITMLLKQLQYSNSINESAVKQINNTLKILDEKEG